MSVDAWKWDAAGMLLAATLGVLAAAAIYVLGCAPSGEQVTVVEGTRLVDFSSKLEACRQAGREAGSYAVYEACEHEAGLR